jgi:hypothetical protein
MSESQSTKNPLNQLVLFMVCLAVAGTVFAGVNYLISDHPAQNAIQAPENSGEYYCFYKCQLEFDDCVSFSPQKNECLAQRTNCLDNCVTE